MNAIEIKNLSKSYEDFSLKDISLSLPEGCILGLIGENGAGKSTLIRSILGLAKADAGSVKLLGRASEELEKAKEDIGVVLDSVGLPSDYDLKKVNSLMKGNYKNWDEKTYFDYIERFELPLNKRFADFSKGMKMKAGLAAALSHGAKLLILDEATSGLDPVIRDELLDIFLEFTRERQHSILISSHIVSDLEKVCDYIAFLHKGRLMLFDEKDALKDKYCLVKCSREQLLNIDGAQIVGKRINPYGAEAIVNRESVEKGMLAEPVGIEELFVMMVRGEEK